MNIRRLESRLNQWGNFEIIQPLAGGHRNAAWLIKRAGQLSVAKTTRRSEAALQWLTPVHDAAEACGMVVPRLRPSRNGLFSVEGLTMESYIEGTSATAKSFVGLSALLDDFHYRTRMLPQRPGFASSIQLLEQTAGGDVDFAEMPAKVVDACRDAWRIFRDKPQSVVHGDLNLSNIIVTANGQPALIDWDESRVDASIFDQLALGQPENMEQRQISHAARRALLAWEIAVCWHVEHDYAQNY